MKTEDLIDELSERAAPVRPLPAPWVRATVWFAVGLPLVVAVIVAHKGSFDVTMVTGDPRLLVEELALVATAVTAALAAFQTTVPGADRRWLLLPLVGLGVWLGSVGEGCVADYLRLGMAGLSLRVDAGCLVPLLLIGPIPAVMMVVMLRRGAPLMPRLSLAYAGIAVAALANAGLRLFHVGDLTVMVLVWHVGLVAALAGLAGSSGRAVLRWRHQATEAA